MGQCHARDGGWTYYASDTTSGSVTIADLDYSVIHDRETEAVVLVESDSCFDSNNPYCGSISACVQIDSLAALDSTVQSRSVGELSLTIQVSAIP
jgi:hypothetical protein